MVTEFRCKNERRLQIARTQTGANGAFVNGIDYLEVASDQRTVIVHLLHDLSETQTLNQSNVIVDRNGDSVQVAAAAAFGNRLTVQLQTEGDQSLYTLQLVESPANLAQRVGYDPSHLPPPNGFDVHLSQIQFSFDVSEASEFDCEPAESTLDRALPPPAIDYLAKDYASFRQLLLDRLAVTMPEWKERNPSDLGVMLVEVLAYAGDYLSYYQDAVATEAYLGTARKRVSVRRHARLLDYFLDDGCNARAWVSLTVDRSVKNLKVAAPDPAKLIPGTRFFTKVKGLPVVLQNEDVEKAISAGAQVFESLQDLTAHDVCNEILIYTWGEEICTLSIGTTQATLKDPGGELKQIFTVGKVIIFEEQRNPNTGKSQDIDLNHRHAVRLTKVTPTEDPLFVENGKPQQVLEIEWAAEDALPFAVTVSTIINGRLYNDISVIRGNVLLVDQGRTVPNRAIDLSDLEGKKANANQDPKLLDEAVLNRVPATSRYRPMLKRGGLTQQAYMLDRQNRWVLFDPEASAQAVFSWQMRYVRPSLFLREYGTQVVDWTYQPDLLNSERFSRDFVVETEDDGRTYLRFGDNVLGKRPEAGTYFQVVYRVGNGKVGNVGAESIAHIAFPNAGITQVRNPLPAKGGLDPEPIDSARLYAPQAFYTQQRAVTEADYAEVAQRHPEVQKAVATRRWTGSWYTIFLNIDRKGGKPVDEAFKQKMRRWMEQFRLSGHDLSIDPPRYVPLDIAMSVQLEPDYFRSAIKKALLDVFSNRVLLNNQLGFFHPDRLTFGEPIYLSRVIETALQVDGVRSVEVNRFQRLGQIAQDEIKIGQISFGALEIARLDNDPTAVQNGRIEFEMEGGL